MDRRDEDAGSIAWPGFVDILSAVIIMFVFFVMITSIVMYALNVEFQEQMKKENERKVSEMVSEQFQEKLENILSGDVSYQELKDRLEYEITIDEMTEQRQKLEQENTSLSYEMEELEKVIEQIKADMAEGTEQETKIGSDNSLLIIFQKNDITLSEQTIKVVETFVSNVIENNEGTRLNVKLLTSDNPNAQSISVSRELSLARSLNVRNVLLKDLMVAEQIEISYAKPTEIEETYNWLKVVIQADE